MGCLVVYCWQWSYPKAGLWRGMWFPAWPYVASSPYPTHSLPWHTHTHTLPTASLEREGEANYRPPCLETQLVDTHSSLSFSLSPSPSPSPSHSHSLSLSLLPSRSLSLSLPSQSCYIESNFWDELFQLANQKAMPSTICSNYIMSSTIYC